MDPLEVQQGLEMRGFWFQKKSVQLKTALREVTPMLQNFCFSKNPCICRAFAQNPRISRLLLCSSEKKIKKVGFYQGDATGLR
jgi:hypothetical protein